MSGISDDWEVIYDTDPILTDPSVKRNIEPKYKNIQNSCPTAEYTESSVNINNVINYSKEVLISTKSLLSQVDIDTISRYIPPVVTEWFTNAK